MIVPIIPAAGAGSRFGKTKALGELQGKTFLEMIVSSLDHPQLAQPRVVIGASADEVRARHAHLSVTWVLNPDWPTSGMRESIACALVGLDGDALIWPVDGPFAEPAIIHNLLQVFLNHNLKKNVIPTYLDQPGHPVIATRLALRQLPSCKHLRELLDKTPSLRTPVGSPSVLKNINTSSDT